MRETDGRRGDFLERKSPHPQRTCQRIMAVKTCLTAFCLRQNFGVFLRKVFKSLRAAFLQPFLKNPPEFSPAGENSVPRQGIWPFNLKAKFTDRANARLNRCSQNEKSLLAAFSKFRSSLFKGLRFPKAEPLVALRRGRKPLYGIFFLLSFFFCACYRQKKKRQTIFEGERPVSRRCLKG